MNAETNHLDVYEIVTNRIIEQLHQNVIPWKKPWTDAGHPKNLLTHAPYRGINVWLLASLGYEKNYFLTWKQLKAIGGSVTKGEKSHLVVFWKKLDTQAEMDDKPNVVLRYYKVFNISQCVNLPELYTAVLTLPTVNNILACDDIIEQMPNRPSIKHGKAEAFYDSLKDAITIPKQGSFTSAKNYYCTLFHELVHSTGHQSRLNRKEITEPNKFGSEQYSIEELTAQIGACYLNSISGIGAEDFENDVAYIQSWIKVLQNDHRMIIYASSQAQKATDFILNVKPYQDYKDENTLKTQ